MEKTSLASVTYCTWETSVSQAFLAAFLHDTHWALFQFGSVRFISTSLTVQFGSVRFVSTSLTVQFGSVRFVSTSLTVQFGSVRFVSFRPVWQFSSVWFVSTSLTVWFGSVCQTVQVHSVRFILLKDIGSSSVRLVRVRFPSLKNDICIAH